MSLLIWVPGARSRNQGIANTTVTFTSGVIYDPNGKFDNCLYFNGDTFNYVSYEMTRAIGTSDFTLALWVKIPKITSGTYYAICTAKSGAAKSAGIGIYWNYAQKKFLWSTADGTTATEIWMSTTVDTIVYDKWIHIAMVRNSSDSKIGYFYINGIRYELASVPAIRNITVNTKFYVSKCSDNNYPTVMYLSEIRFYDHAISAKEAKILSQALVCHYPLNDNAIQQMSNVYSYPTFNTSTATGGWSHWGASGASGTNGQNTDTQFIYNKSNTYSHWISNASTATGNYLLYQSPSFGGGSRSLCCIAKESNGVKITEDILFPTWNARSGGVPVNIWTSIQSLGDGFYLCKVEGIQQDGSNNLAGFYVRPGYKVYISEAYLENDRKVCSDIRYYTTAVYDCAGNWHNGTCNSSLVMNNSSPRNSYSTTFNGTSNSITLPDYSPYPSGSKQSEMSFAMWVNRNEYSDSTTRYIYLGFCDIYLYSDYKVRITWSHDTASASATNTWAPGLLIPIGEWHHICFTFTSGVMRLYYDGALYGTSDRSSTGQFMGVYRGYPKIGNNQFGGSLSDFRIYSTALSADDIKALYDTPVSVADNGTVLTQGEFIEQ